MSALADRINDPRLPPVHITSPTGIVDEIKKAAQAVENELTRSHTAESPVAYAPPQQRADAVAVPEWAKILDETTTTGLLAAKAVAIDFERVAKEIETLGSELASVASEHDAMMTRLRTALSEILDTANVYRTHGAELLAEIQLSSQKVLHVHNTIATLKAALGDMVAKTVTLVEPASKAAPVSGEEVAHVDGTATA